MKKQTVTFQHLVTSVACVLSSPLIVGEPGGQLSLSHSDVYQDFIYDGETAGPCCSLLTLLAASQFTFFFFFFRIYCE